MSCIARRGLKVAGRGRLLRARPRLPGVMVSGLRGTFFSPEQELLLSRTETGLEVWNCWWDESLLMNDSSFFMVRLPPEKESSTKFESHSS